MKHFEVVQNIPSPYRLHLFNEMWHQLKDKGIDFHVNFMSSGHAERPDNWRNPDIAFPHTYWKDLGFKSYHFNPGLIWHIKREKPDYLLVGSPFDTFTSIGISCLCDYGVRCTWVEGQTKTPGKMTGFTGWFKRKIFSKYPLVGVPGSDGAKYFKMHQEKTSLAMPRPILLPNIVDETRFRPRLDWPKEDISEARNSLGVEDDETRICIIPARLDSVKGLVEFVDLLDASMVKGWKIVILGQGPLKEKIINTAKQRKTEENLLILDYVPYADMPKFYAASDLFLLPSLHDPNPLSVVEALHSGLPVAVSDRCGNVEEAVTPGRNGWRLPVLHEEKYRICIREIFSTPLSMLKTMGECSLRESACFWNTKESVGRFLADMIESEEFDS